MSMDFLIKFQQILKLISEMSNDKRIPTEIREEYMDKCSDIIESMDINNSVQPAFHGTTNLVGKQK